MAILDGAEDFQPQITETLPGVKSYLQKQFQEFLSDERFQDGLDGNLPPAAGPGRAARARSILEAIVGEEP